MQPSLTPRPNTIAPDPSCERRARIYYSTICCYDVALSPPGPCCTRSQIAFPAAHHSIVAISVLEHPSLREIGVAFLRVSDVLDATHGRTLTLSVVAPARVGATAPSDAAANELELCVMVIPVAGPSLYAPPPPPIHAARGLAPPYPYGGPPPCMAAGGHPCPSCSLAMTHPPPPPPMFSGESGAAGSPTPSFAPHAGVHLPYPHYLFGGGATAPPSPCGLGCGCYFGGGGPPTPPSYAAVASVPPSPIFHGSYGSYAHARPAGPPPPHLFAPHPRTHTMPSFLGPSSYEAPTPPATSTSGGGGACSAGGASAAVSASATPLGRRKEGEDGVDGTA